MKEGIESWLTCKYSLAFGLLSGDESGYVLREEGYNENYGCENQEIVNSAKFKITSFSEGPNLTRVAVLHGIGKATDPNVIASLNESCGKCPFYINRLNLGE